MTDKTVIVAVACVLGAIALACLVWVALGMPAPDHLRPPLPI
jgi:hypothetical protein